MGGKLTGERFVNPLTCMSGGSCIFACDETHELRCIGGG